MERGWGGTGILYIKAHYILALKQPILSSVINNLKTGEPEARTCAFFFFLNSRCYIFFGVQGWESPN